MSDTPTFADARLANLYRALVLEHAVQPVGRAADIPVTHQAEGRNPVCGDHICVGLQVQQDRIVAARFDGDSCAICTAAASLLCAHSVGLDQPALEQALAGFLAEVADPGQHDCPKYLHALTGVRHYPARLGCASLPWRTALNALAHPQKN